MMPPPPFHFKDSAILLDDKYGVVLKQWLVEKGMGGNPVVNLLYLGTVHDKRAADFHAHCDHKGPTITLVRCTGGNIVGGFNPTAWTSSDVWKTTNEVPTAFLFSLVNPFNLKPQKFYVKPGNSHAVLCSSLYGPSFGNTDIRITDYLNGSHSVLDGSYGTAGVDPNMFTGAKGFTPAEVEMWQLVG
jgi:hypothetical protein